VKDKVRLLHSVEGSNNIPGSRVLAQALIAGVMSMIITLYDHVELCLCSILTVGVDRTEGHAPCRTRVGYEVSGARLLLPALG